MPRPIMPALLALDWTSKLSVLRDSRGCSSKFGSMLIRAVCSSMTALRTFFRIRLDTLIDPFITRETVAVETPARVATSLTVGLTLSEAGESPGGADRSPTMVPAIQIVAISFDKGLRDGLRLLKFGPHSTSRPASSTSSHFLVFNDRPARRFASRCRCLEYSQNAARRQHHTVENLSTTFSSITHVARVIPRELFCLHAIILSWGCRMAYQSSDSREWVFQNREFRRASN